ncbi:MAG: hypothetical protein PHP52_14660, partial [Bacteroidales bacterium]|nr:hypothetical protein [Bacteroidales bacterium]
MFSTIKTYNTTTSNCNYIQSLVASVNPQQRKPETKITTEYYYVGGPMGNVAVYISENGAEPELYYTITDHLGSIVAIADEDGEIIEEQRYDPWGNYRNPLTGTPEENPQL